MIRFLFSPKPIWCSCCQNIPRLKLRSALVVREELDLYLQGLRDLLRGEIGLPPPGRRLSIRCQAGWYWRQSEANLMFHDVLTCCGGLRMTNRNHISIFKLINAALKAGKIFFQNLCPSWRERISIFTAHFSAITGALHADWAGSVASLSRRD